MIGAVADFVAADQLEAVQAAGGQLLGHDPREDLPDRLPPDPHQPRDLRVAHLLRQPRRQILEIAGVSSARPRPRHRLVQIAAAGAIQPSEPALDHAPQATKVKIPPRLRALLLELQAARAAARADRLVGSQHNGHDHRPLAELHVPDPCTRKPEHPVECGADSHVALLRRPLDFEHPAACRRRAAAGRHVRAQPARRTYPATNPALTRRFRETATSVSPPDGEESRLFSSTHRTTAASGGFRYRPPRRRPSRRTADRWRA